jgi:hypothetical protein
MKQTSFVALSVDERNAVIDALRRGGVATRQVCVSRLDEREAAAPVTMVTTAHSCFSYHGSGAEAADAQEPAAGAAPTEA